MTRLTFIGADGTESELVDKSTGGLPYSNSGGCGTPAARDTVFVSRDGGGMTFIADSTIVDEVGIDVSPGDPSGWLLFPNGTRYRIDASLVTQIKDRNGNFLTIEYDTYDGYPLKATDSIGRVTTVTSTASQDAISFYGFGATSRGIIINFDLMSTVLGNDLLTGDPYTLLTYGTHSMSAGTLWGSYGGGAGYFNPTVITSIELPNTTEYQFKYNSYGEVVDLTLPTGGEYRYLYDGGLAGTSPSLFVYRRLLRKHTLVGGNTVERTVYSVDSTAGAIVADHQTGGTTGTSISQDWHYFNGYADHPTDDPLQADEIRYSTWTFGREFKTEARNAGGTTVLRTIQSTLQQRTCESDEHCLTNGSAIDPRTADTTTTLQDGTPNLVSKQVFSYDRYNNRTRTEEYAYGSGSAGGVVRATGISYMGGSYATDTSIYLRSLPSIVTTYDSDGSTQRAQTTYEYDVYTGTGHAALTNRTSVSEHDSSYGTSYDGLGRVTQTRQYEGTTCRIVVNTTYDSLGRIHTTSNPYRDTSYSSGRETCTAETERLTTTAYDALGRISSVQTADGSTTGYSYATNTTTATDPAGVKRKSTSDALGRLTQVQEDPDTLTYTTSYTYDPMNNLTVVAQGTQPHRTFFYDGLSRLTAASNPESGETDYTYDANGNLLTKTDSRSIVATMTYDNGDRVTSKTYSDGTPSVAYEYDVDRSNPAVGSPSNCSAGTHSNYCLGRLTKVSTTASTTIYKLYDALGRAAGSSQTTNSAGPYPFGYTYNLAGGLTSVTYPSTRVVNYGFDGAGRVNGVTNYADSITYASQGAIKALAMHNAVTETTAWDSYRLQPSSITAVKGGTTLFNLSYSYCASGASSCSTNNGNLVGQTIGSIGAAQSYGYDALNRLAVAAEGPALTGLSCPTASVYWCETYGYDQYGNRWISGARTGVSSALTEPSVTPRSSSWIDASTNRVATAAGAMYDSAGNETHAYGQPGSLSYDAENRLTAIALDSSLVGAAKTYSYFYDGDGRRVRKSLDGLSVDNTYLYGANGELASEYRNGAWLKDYIYLGGRLLAVEDSRVTGTSYLTVDHLGSTRLVTDAGGNVKSRHDYFPFGKEIEVGLGGRYAVAGYAETGTSITAGPNLTGQPTDEFVLQRFTGKERDPETGLDYFIARYFSGAQGRFMSPDTPLEDQDPSNPQSWNLYGYVRNNPLRGTDPSGRDCIYTENSSVSVVRGDCKSDTDNGVFVNGTVDAVDYHSFSNTLGFSYTGENGSFGVGVINDVDLSSHGPSPGLLALRDAGNRASRDISTSAIMIGAFATAYASTYAVPAFIGWYATLGETGAVGPGVGLLRLAQKYGLNLNSPKSRQLLENLDTRVEDFVGKYRLGSIKQAEGWTFDGMTVRQALDAGARKLLTDSRFDK